MSTVVERWCSDTGEKLATAAERMVEDALLSEAGKGERIGPESQGCLAQMVDAEEAKKRWTWRQQGRAGGKPEDVALLESGGGP